MRRLFLLTILLGAGLSLSCGDKSEADIAPSSAWARTARVNTLLLTMETIRTPAGSCYVVARSGYGLAITVAATPKDCE